MFREIYATGALVFPSSAHVLEIGCAEADWQTPMLAARPDLHLTGIDWREVERPGTVIQGDVLTHDFPEASFDAVVGVSSIEHVGLGHYNSDPLDVDGDRHCMERVARWLKPGGWVYADVPWGDQYAVVGTSHREYDDVALADRLVVPGLRVRRCWWFSEHRFRPCDAPPARVTNHMVYVAFVAEKES